MENVTGAQFAEAFYRWLCLSGHSVLETVGGPVFHDETTSFSKIKDLLSWYPEEVWHFVLASGWQKLAQSLHYVGRTADTGQETWQEREQGLVDAIEVLAAKQRDIGLPAPNVAVQQFFDRPYRTVTAGMAERLREGAGDLQALPLIGSIEQWVDSEDILARPEYRPAALETYRALILRRAASA